ncbi:Uma2 family endonuclease [Neobacillus jeddahensis]|uniref:Uma2 family endonuclease n=1 Tax=Neobacillus jeddahensis TaxID=1461580 RepID=UPI00058C9FDC|nr:Uma2 family endonuclease [Neobacillus jeddahensis]
MSINQPHSNYTYADYLKSPEDVHYEVIDGQIISMSPAPTTKHQHVQRELLIEFGTYLRGKECSVYGSPIDVCLFADQTMSNEKIKDWVQPDIVVVCDRNKINHQNIVGAPDLAIEILSPSTARNDRVIKFNHYQKAGVREYWIVDPSNEFVEVFLLQNNRFISSGFYTKEDSIKVNILEDLTLSLKHIFSEY